MASNSTMVCFRHGISNDMSSRGILGSEVGGRKRGFRARGRYNENNIHIPPSRASSHNLNGHLLKLTWLDLAMLLSGLKLQAITMDQVKDMTAGF